MVYSFSVKPDNIKDSMLVEGLKLHCEREGIKFSKVVLKAIRLLNNEENIIKGLKDDE